MNKHDLGQALLAACHLRGEFQLRSGVTSSEYFDKYRFESDPHLLHQIAIQLVELLPTNVDALAGLELGGIPIVTALSLNTGLPALFVRKAAKDYGTCQVVEGGTVRDRRIVVVEDVVTSGGQILISAEELRKLGAQIVGVLCVVDR